MRSSQATTANVWDGRIANTIVWDLSMKAELIQADGGARRLVWRPGREGESSSQICRLPLPPLHHWESWQAWVNFPIAVRPVTAGITCCRLCFNRMAPKPDPLRLPSDFTGSPWLFPFPLLNYWGFLSLVVESFPKRSLSVWCCKGGADASSRLGGLRLSLF